MSELLRFSWLIPTLPFAGSALIGVLLFSFNRTMNRLTKPISWFLISCVALSTIYSFIAFKSHLSGNILNIDFLTEKIGYPLGLYIDDQSLLFSIVFGFIELIIMISSYIFLNRNKGYVRYIITIGIISSIIFSFFLSGEYFHTLMDPLVNSVNDFAIS